jgi:signal transduction histidine kinase
VTSILSGAKSIARIVGAMREFSRSDAPEMRPADLNRAIHATLEVVRHEYRQIADVDLALGDLPQVQCHVGEIQQVVANLIVNAAHAIDRREPKTQGIIRIESLHDKARGRIEIAISDNGIGIPPENRDRVFDPFFTTKPVGRGTGQGLAIAHNVVARHSGVLTFESTPGVGTRFLVSLPVRGPTRDRP